MSLLDTLFQQQAFVISLMVVAFLIVSAFAVLVGASVVQWRRQHPAKKRSKTKLARQHEEESAVPDAAEQVVTANAAAAVTAASAGGQTATATTQTAAPAALVPPAIVQAALTPAGSAPAKGGAVEKVSGINDILASVFTDDKAEHRKTLLQGVDKVGVNDLLSLAAKIRDGLITQKTAKPE
ncbi:MAG: hypothetical protein KF716_21340 [Anaerolineae bacterium]|nr:hypothetical protein [Anaerolineae bacterium]